MENSRARALIIVVLVLAALRFIAVPWVQSQNESREQLQLQTNRLDRSIGVLANKVPLEKGLQAVHTDVDALRRRYPVAATPAQYRIEVQRRLGDIAAAHTVQLRTFDWKSDGRLPEAGLSYGRVGVTIEGPLKDLIRMHGAIEAELPNAAIRDINLVLSGPATSTLEASGTMSITADILYRSAGA